MSDSLVFGRGQMEDDFTQRNYSVLMSVTLVCCLIFTSSASLVLGFYAWASNLSDTWSWTASTLLRFMDWILESSPIFSQHQTWPAPDFIFTVSHSRVPWDALPLTHLSPGFPLLGSISHSASTWSLKQQPQLPCILIFKVRLEPLKCRSQYLTT